MKRCLLLGLFVGACGGASAPPDHDGGVSGTDSGASDASRPDSGAIDAAMNDAAQLDASPMLDAGASDDAGQPTADAGSFPGCGFTDALDHTCMMDSDCAFGVHQTNCCGDTAAIGLNSSQSGLFAAWEPLCDATYPLCGCLTHPTTTDSGETALDPGSIQVACVTRGTRRVCLTYVTMRPPEGR